MIIGIDHFSMPLLTQVCIQEPHTFKGVLDHASFSELHIKNTVSGMPAYGTEDWRYDTVLLAKFKGNLEAGSVNADGAAVDKIVVKRQEVGTNQVITVGEIPFTDGKIDVEFIDKTTSPLKKYQYYVVPMSGLTEGTYNMMTVETELSSAVIFDADKRYAMEYGFQLSDISYVMPNNTIETLGKRRTPYVAYHGDLDYMKGSAKAYLVADPDEPINLRAEKTLRDKFMAFLRNKRPKMLKTNDGFHKLIAITGEPSLTNEGRSGLYSVSFSFVEIGDVDNARDLYDTGFLKVGE